MTDQERVDRCTAGAVNLKPGETLYPEDVKSYVDTTLRADGGALTYDIVLRAQMAVLSALRVAGRKFGVRDDDSEPFAIRERPPEWDQPQQSTDDDWVARYTFSAEMRGGLDSAAARVALADAAPAEFRRDTGREPPHDLIARVFAAISKLPK